MFNRTTHLARLSCGNLAKFGHRRVFLFTMCLLPWAFAHTSHASRSEIEVQLVDWKHVINMWNHCVSEHLLRFQSFCSSCWMRHSDSGESFFQLAQSTASEYLEKMYVSLYYIVFMYWRHWSDDVCADALLKHFSCIILCRLAFGCLQWYKFTLFSFGFSIWFQWFFITIFYWVR